MGENKVIIWGCRGSFPQTDINKKKYGLNTSCISIETQNEIFLIDCGTGIHDFDKYFYKNKLTNKKLNILLTHYHHDHICGLVNTKFVYDQKVKVEIFGQNDVYKILDTYYNYPYFPVPIMASSNISTTSIKPNQILKFKDLELETTLLCHPQSALGYKFYADNKILAIITDYEYRSDTERKIVENFILRSDYLIIDAFFTDEDYIDYWGHNSIKDIIDIVRKFAIGKCLLYHHNTEYDDEKLDKIQLDIEKNYKNIIVAREKFSFYL